MSMGHRQKLSAEEQDAVTGWRHYLCWRPGERSAVKRRGRRRERHQARQDIRRGQIGERN